MMEESKAVNLTEQDRRNPRTSQKVEGERLRYRCYKKTPEAKTRTGQNASRQYQETDHQTRISSDYNHDQDSKDMQDINRYYEYPSNTEIVIGNIRPIRKIQKIYVKESDDEAPRNMERKFHQIDTRQDTIMFTNRTRYFHIANVSMLSQIYEETRKSMVDVSVGSMHSRLHETHKRRNYTHYRRRIRHLTKNQNKYVGLGADSRKNMQVHQKLSPIQNVQSRDQSQEIDHAIAVNEQATSRRKEEQVVQNLTVTLTRDTSDSEGYELAEDSETVCDCARTIVNRGDETDSIMIHKSYDRRDIKSSESLMKDIWTTQHKLLDIDTPSEGEKPTYPTVSKVSSKRLLKTKLEKEQKEKMTNCNKTKLTDVIIEGSKCFLLSLRHRFGALMRRLGLKEEQFNNTQNPTLKDSSSSFTSSPSYKDVSITSDPPSLVARPYYIYNHQKMHCNNAKVKFQLMNKKNLDSDKCSRNVNARPRNKQVKQARNIKNNRKDINTLNSTVSDNTAARFAIPGKKYVTSCNVNNHVEMKISDNPEAKIEKASKTVRVRNRRNKKHQFISKVVKPNEKKVRVRWDKITYQRGSSSATFGLINCLYEEAGLDFRSSIKDSEKHSQIQSHNPFRRNIPVFVLHSCDYQTPIDNEKLLSRKYIKNQNQKKQSRVRTAKKKSFFWQRRKQSVRTEIVFHAMHNKGKSYEKYRLVTPSELSGYNKDREHQSKEMVFQVVNYESSTSTNTDKTAIEDYERLAVTQDCGCTIEIPELSTFMRIVDYEIKSTINTETTEDEVVNTDSIRNGHECTSQSYANTSCSESDSHVLGIYPRSCPNFLENYDAYIHKYIDDICDAGSSCFKQSGMTAMVNQLKRIWHTLQGKGALLENYIYCEPNVLEVFKNTKYLAGSWAASLSDGVDWDNEAEPVRMKKSPIPSHEPGISESHADVDIKKDDKKSARISRVNVMPIDGDVNRQKFTLGQKNLALPLRSLHDREAVKKQTKDISRMQVSDEIINIYGTKYQTIAETPSITFVILKFLLSSINMAKKRRKFTRSHSTQFTPLFQDTHYTQYSFLSKTKSLPNLKSQSTQEPSEKSCSILKATHFSIQNCQTKSYLQCVASPETPFKQSYKKRKIKQKNYKSASKQCSKSSNDIQKAMSNIRAKVLQRPYPKSKDSIRQSLCKIMDQFMELPLCTLKSVLGGKPTLGSTQVKKSHMKKIKNKCTKGKITCDCPPPSKYILPSTPTMSSINESVDSYQESLKDDELCTQTNLKDQYPQEPSKETISIPKDKQFFKEDSKKSQSTPINLQMEIKLIIKQKPLKDKSKSASKSEECCCIHSKDTNKYHDSKPPSKKSGTNSNVIDECPAPFPDVTTWTLTKAASSDNFQSSSSDETLTQNGNPSRDVCGGQNIIKSRPYEDGSLSKKHQKSVNKDLCRNFSVKWSFKVSRKPRKQSVYTVNVPITPGAKGKETKYLPTVQTDIAKRETIVIVLQPSFVCVKSENTKQKNISSKIPIRCPDVRLVLPANYKQYEKNKSLEKPKTNAPIKETAHTVTGMPLRTHISYLPRRPISGTFVQRTKEVKSDSLKSLQPEQSNPGKDYSDNKCSKTRKKDKESTTSGSGTIIQTATIPTQKKTLIDDNDVKGQKETKPPAIWSSSRDTNKPAKQKRYATSVPVKPRITNFNYAVDQSGLSTQCKLDTPVLSLKSGEFNENFPQLRIHNQRDPYIGVSKFRNLDYNLDTGMIRFDDVKRKIICSINPDKDCPDPKETTAATELLNSSITTEGKSLPGTENSSDVSSSKILSEEPLGSSRDKSSNKKSDRSYDSEVTPQLEQQCLLSVDNSCKMDKNCVCISRRNKTLTSESSSDTKVYLLKSLKPISKSPKTFPESTDKSPISQESSKCYCLNCQDTKSKNGPNGGKSSQSSSTSSSIGPNSKKSSEEFTQSVQEKSSSKKSNSHKTTSDATKNASGSSSTIGSPQCVCQPCNEHNCKNDDCPFKTRSEQGKKKKLSDINIKYNPEIYSSKKETIHGSNSTKTTTKSSFSDRFASRREISSSKTNSPETSQKFSEGKDCRESQDQTKTKLKKCSKYTSSQKELKNKQNKENKSDSEIKLDDGDVTPMNLTYCLQCGTRTYTQKLNEENTKKKEQINFMKSRCSQPGTETTSKEFCDKRLKSSSSSLKSSSLQPETTRTLKKPCELFSLELATKKIPKKPSDTSICQPETETTPKKTKTICIQSDKNSISKQTSDSSLKSCYCQPEMKTTPIEAKTISTQTEITTKRMKSSSSHIASEQKKNDKYSDDINSKNEQSSKAKTESELLFLIADKEEHSGSKTAYFKRGDKILRISPESQSPVRKKKSKHVKKDFLIRDAKDRIIIERRDYSADDEEELEDKNESDSDNDKAVEIRFTLKICPDNKSKEVTIANVVKNNQSLEMCQTSNNPYANQDRAKSYFDDAIKPNDVNVQITIRKIAHQSNQTNTDIGNKLSDETIKVLTKNCEDCRSFIPIKPRTNGISGYRKKTSAENSICTLKSYTTESEMKSLIDKYQKDDILDQTNALNKFYNLRMKGNSASSPDIYKQRNVALEYSDNKLMQLKIIPVENFDNTTKQQRRQKLQNDKIELTNEKSIFKNNPRSDFVSTNVELNSNESKGVQFVGLKPKDLKNTDSMNNYYSMSTTPDYVMPGSFEVVNEGLLEWRSDTSTGNNLRKKLKKCVCASATRKLDLQDVQCSCKKNTLVTKKTSCQLSRDHLTFQTAKEPPLKNSHHNRTTAAFMTYRSEADSKSKINKHRRNKDKLEKHRFDYKSKTTEVLFETRHYQESSSISQEKKTKTFSKTIDNPDILQSYAMKKAVLEIYKENKSTDDKDKDLTANLPKFSSRDKCVKYLRKEYY